MAKNRIGILRREQGMNQRELGTYLGVGQTTVSAWETGKNEPDNESMHKMAKLFHVSIDYLTGYSNDEKNRGLTEAEKEELLAEYFRQREERNLQKWAREEEMLERGISDEELAEIEETELLYEWDKTDKSMYFEVFQINKMCDYLSQEQRERMLKVIQTMFPHAARNQYVDETPHK